MNPDILQRVRHLRSFVPETFETLPGNIADLKVYDEGHVTTFYHSGDFGDIIYALPTIRSMGGGILVIGPEMKLGFEVRTRQRFTREIFNVIAPLLRIQPYLTDVQFSASMPEVDVDLNQFRRYFVDEAELRRKGDRRLNLAEIHLWSFQQPLDACTQPWLTVDKTIALERPVLIHRSARWRNHAFPWCVVLEAHGHQASFVGMESEYEEFSRMWRHICQIPFIKTDNFLELARLIAGSELYIGNQSAPYAIAEGLKKTTLQEVWPEGPNCLFPRPNAYYGEGNYVYIPKLSKIMTTEVVNCPLCDGTTGMVVRERADIVECAVCKTVYLRTRLTKEHTEALYQTYADGNSHMRLPTTVDEMRTSGLRRDCFMQRILQYYSKAGDSMGSLLDIGCGWGAFLANARQKGFEPVGVDICAKMVNYAKDVMALQVHGNQLEDCNFASNAFSVVTALHTLEHLPNQKSALSYIYRILRPGGLFCGILPNFNSLCSTKHGNNWVWLDPAMHYIHFTPETLRAALEKHGFTVLNLVTSVGDANLADIRKQIQAKHEQILGDKEMEDLITACGEAGEGEEIQFVAQKAC